MSETALAHQIPQSEEEYAPDVNWRQKLSPGEMTVGELLKANSLPLLPRAKYEDVRTREQITLLRETIEAAHGDLRAIPSPVIHRASERVLDGSTTIIPAIIAWVHSTSPSTPSSVIVPVLYHTGNLIQATYDILHEDTTRGLKRTSADRAQALRSFLETLRANNEDVPSSAILMKMFHLHKTHVLNMRSEIYGREGRIVGRDGKRYSAAQELVMAASQARMANLLAKRPNMTKATDEDEDDELDNLFSSQSSSQPSVNRQNTDQLSTSAIVDRGIDDAIDDVLEPYAAAEAAVNELVQAIKKFLSLNNEAVKRDGTSLVLLISDDLFQDAKTQISSLSTIWRFARRNKD